MMGIRRHGYRLGLALAFFNLPFAVLAATPPAYLLSAPCREVTIAASGKSFIVEKVEDIRLVEAPRNYGHRASPEREGNEPTAKGEKPLRPLVVAHRGVVYKNFALDKRDGLRSPVLVSSKGLIPDGSQRLVVMLHGMGATISHMGAWLRFANELETHLPGTAFAAMDLPRHGMLREVPWEPGLHELVDYFAAELTALKKESGLPLILAARSASAGIGLHIAKKYPGLIDKLLLIGATPSREDLLVEIERYIDILVSEKKLVMNGPAYLYAQRLMRQMDFHGWQWGEWATPTQIFFSEKDPEMPDATRAFWKTIASLNRQVHITEFQGTSHDPFGSQHHGVADEAWKNFGEFVR